MELDPRLTPLPLHTELKAGLSIEPELDEVDDLTGFVEMAPIELSLQESDCGERLDKVVARMVPQFSRSRMQQWIDAGFVSVDGKPGRTRMTVYGDERVVILPQARVVRSSCE